MSDEYYVDMSGHTAGPFTGAQLRDLLSAGTITEQTLFSKPGGIEWLPIQMILPLILRPPLEAPSPPPPIPASPAMAKPRARRSDRICATCGYIGRPKLETKGSFLFEVCLWLLFCAPGLIYSLWRLTSRSKVCPQCSAPSMIPATSPRGRQLANVA